VRVVILFPVDVIIPALNASSTIEATVRSVRAKVRGVIVVDGGSSDDTVSIAKYSGAKVGSAPRGRGGQLAAGAGESVSDWLLFLHGDTLLQKGWDDEIRSFIDETKGKELAAAFRFRLDDDRRRARMIEKGVAWRCRTLGLPFGDQGLVISRRFYDRLGGFKPVPLFEDVDIVRRIGKARIRMLDSAAITSAARYRNAGYIFVPIRNLILLTLYFCGVAPRILARFYV
jgi:rSAM/selenodomain-associated transferase 2